MLIEIGNSIEGVVYFGLNKEGMISIQKQEYTTIVFIHWLEFCMRYLTEYLDHTWGEVEIDTTEVSAEPCSIVESFYRQFQKKT